MEYEYRKNGAGKWIKCDIDKAYELLERFGVTVNESAHEMLEWADAGDLVTVNELELRLYHRSTEPLATPVKVQIEEDGDCLYIVA